MDGIKNKIDPPAPVDLNIYDMTAAERRELGIDTLPSNLGEALQELSRNQLIRETLGTHIYSRFVEAKTIEWNDYQAQVHQWELDRYLSVF